MNPVTYCRAGPYPSGNWTVVSEQTGFGKVRVLSEVAKWEIQRFLQLWACLEVAASDVRDPMD